MFKFPEIPQTAIDIIINGFRLWKYSFWKLAGLILFAVVFGSLPNFFIAEFNTYDPLVTLNFIAKNSIYVAIYLLIILYLFAVILYRAKMIVYREKGGFIRALYVGLFRMPYLILALLFFNISVSIGFVLFVIPGIVIAILLSLYFVLIVADNENPFKAYKHSWQLVTDNWWHTFAVVIGSFLTFLIIALCLDLLAEDIWTMAHPSGGNIWLGYHILRMLIGFLFYPFFCSILLLLRHDLKLRKGEL